MMVDNFLFPYLLILLSDLLRCLHLYFIFTKVLNEYKVVFLLYVWLMNRNVIKDF